MNNIYVYNGEGSSKEAVDMLFQSIQTFCHNFTVQLISPEDIRKGAWMESAALLAIGGGYDLGYIRALKTDGLHNIKTYVERGGSYLGICAGAYLVCRRIEFDKGGKLEICQPRDLGFFPGVSIGPTYPGFVYNSEAGAHAAHICTNVAMINKHCIPSERITTNGNQGNHISDSDSLNCFVYFNGGSHFVMDDDVSNDVTLISRYMNSPDDKRHAAVVQCRVGKGRAVLSGAHFEYIVDKMDTSNIYLKNVIPKLKDTLQSRNVFYRLVLSLLKLSKL